MTDQQLLPTALAKLAAVAPPHFLTKVTVTDAGCWQWNKTSGDGYGRFNVAGKTRLAHRLTYQWLVGHVPDGLELDHLCRNRGCCNPAHLEPVTHRENVLRGMSPAATFAVTTHCPSGHEYTPENTYLFRSMRYCVTCRDAHTAANKAKRSAEMKSDPFDRHHGKLTGYSSYGCRCDRCKTAWRSYMQARRAGGKR